MSGNYSGLELVVCKSVRRVRMSEHEWGKESVHMKWNYLYPIGPRKSTAY